MKDSDVPEKTTISSHPASAGEWSKPSIPISGPLPGEFPGSWTGFKETLGLNHISEDVGTASGLKCCFATTTKGFTALCLQAFTTAGNCMCGSVIVLNWDSGYMGRETRLLRGPVSSRLLSL